MSKHDKMLDLYQEILKAVNIESTDDGMLSLTSPDGSGKQNIPCTINEKRVVLPTKELVREGNWDNIIPFDPISENLLHGQSDIVKFTRNMAMYRLRSVLAQLMVDLMALAADPERHKDLSPKQSALLTGVQDANAKTAKSTNKLVEKYFEKLITLYLLHSSKDGSNSKHLRMCSTSFPLYEELQTKGNKVFSDDVGSAKAKRTISNLYEFIFTDIDEEDGYSYPSDAGVAPYFQALMLAFGDIAKQLNSVAYKYRKHLDNYELLRTDLGFMDRLGELSDYRNVVPALPGNIGAAGKGKEGEASADTAVNETSPNFLSGNADAASYVTTPAVEQNTSPNVEVSAPFSPQVEHVRTTVGTAPPSTSGKPSNGINWRDVMRASNAGAPMGVGGAPSNPYTNPGHMYGGGPAPNNPYINPNPMAPNMGYPPQNGMMQPQMGGSPVGYQNNGFNMPTWNGPAPGGGYNPGGNQGGGFTV